MFEAYPKMITLADGASLTLRPMTRDDQYALYSFFISLPEENRRWLGNDVTGFPTPPEETAIDVYKALP